MAEVQDSVILEKQAILFESECTKQSSVHDAGADSSSAGVMATCAMESNATQAQFQVCKQQQETMAIETDNLWFDSVHQHGRLHHN